MTWKPRQIRCSLELFTRNRFRSVYVMPNTSQTKGRQYLPQNCPTIHEFFQVEPRDVASLFFFFFITLKNRKIVNISESCFLCLWFASRFTTAKCMRIEKANSNQKSKSWWNKWVLHCVQDSPFWNPTMQVLRKNSNRIQIDAVSSFTRQMKPYCFQNAPLLAAFSNRPCFGNGLDQCRVDRRRNWIESDAVTNETAFV